MSWSFSAVGRPAKVADALIDYGNCISGQSKIEFDAVTSALLTLINQNFSDDPSFKEPIIEFSANGSGAAKPGPTQADPPIQLQRSCQVTLKTLYNPLL